MGVKTYSIFLIEKQKCHAAADIVFFLWLHPHLRLHIRHRIILLQINHIIAMIIHTNIHTFFYHQIEANAKAANDYTHDLHYSLH